MTSNKGTLIIGTTPRGLQAALTLASCGRKVTLVEKDSRIDRAPGNWSGKGRRWNQYLYTQISYHPLIEKFTETEVRDIRETGDGVEVEILHKPQWVLPDLCVDCQKCLASCPVELPSGEKPIFELKAPFSMVIDKREKAPCRMACPLGMNPQGYVALISQGRFEEAYNLITDTNPLPGICGRVCNHPCEKECRRGEMDEPIAICALKRFAADEAAKSKKSKDNKKAISSLKGPKVAIVGSGPSGLTAAHELAGAGFGPP